MSNIFISDENVRHSNLPYLKNLSVDYDITLIQFAWVACGYSFDVRSYKRCSLGPWVVFYCLPVVGLKTFFVLNKVGLKFFRALRYFLLTRSVLNTEKVK